MKISIITACYNCSNEIEGTILSVIGQTYQDIEYIVIDGGSNDGTLDVINRYSDKITKIVSEKDKGVYDAMNKGLLIATGDWVNFMNAGDIFVNNHVLEDVFYDCNCQNSEVVIHGDFIHKHIWGYTFVKGFDGRQNICHQALFTKLDVHKRHLFNLEYKITADQIALREIVTDSSKIKYVPIPICIYKIFGGISSKSNYDLYKALCRLKGKPSIFLYYYKCLWFIIIDFIEYFMPNLTNKFKRYKAKRENRLIDINNYK